MHIYYLAITQCVIYYLAIALCVICLATGGSPLDYIVGGDCIRENPWPSSFWICFL